MLYSMCFNATTSLITFSISVVCSCLLLYTGITQKNKNDLVFSVIVFLIGLMQLIEFFLWKNQKCNKMNHIFSLLIIVLLFLQGCITSIIYYSLYPTNRIFSKSFIFYFLLFYTIFTVYLLYYLNQTKLCSKPSKISCRLTWAPFVYLKNNMLLFYIFSLAYLILSTIIFIEMYFNSEKKYLIRLSFLPLTYILSYLFIIINELNNNFNPFYFINYTDTFGSLWCFIAVFLGIVSILHI
jgi:hypothetical protein